MKYNDAERIGNHALFRENKLGNARKYIKMLFHLYRNKVSETKQKHLLIGFFKVVQSHITKFDLSLSSKSLIKILE